MRYVANNLSFLAACKPLEEPLCDSDPASAGCTRPSVRRGAGEAGDCWSP